MTPEQIAQDWMDRSRQTIATYDHAAHMNLISKNVQVFGIPGFEVIGYDDWHAQSAHEFQQKLIQSADYAGLKVRHGSDTQIMFVTMETITASDGSVDSHPLEAVLSKEDDGQWRVTQQRLLSDEEASHLGIA